MPKPTYFITEELRHQIQVLLDLCKLDPSLVRPEDKVLTALPVLTLPSQFLRRYKNNTEFLKNVVKCMTHKFIPRHEPVMRFGDYGDFFCILLKGQVSGWIPVPSKVAGEPLELFLKSIVENELAANFTLDNAFIHEEDGKAMSYQAYKD